MRRAVGRMLWTLVAVGGFAGCLDIGSVDEPASSGGAGGTGGTAGMDGSGWPDAAGGDTALDVPDASDAADAVADDASDADGPDVPDLGDGSDSSEGDAGSIYADEVLKDKPVLYWRLDEATGPTIIDSSGNGNDGQYLGTTFTFGIGGAVKGDTAVELQGGYLRGPSAFDFAGKVPYSFEAWVRPIGLPTNYARIVSKEEYLSTGRAGWTVLLHDSPTPSLKFERWLDGGTLDGVGYQQALSTTAFTHVVAVYDGVQLHLYVNGAEAQANPGSFALPVTSRPLYFGAFDQYGSNALAAALDEIAIYPTALTSARVVAHYSAAQK